MYALCDCAKFTFKCLFIAGGLSAILVGITLLAPPYMVGYAVWNAVRGGK